MLILISVTLHAVNAPANLEIMHDGTNVMLHWDAVSGARFYKVFVRDTPYGVYELDETGVFPTPTSWTKLEPDSKKFYKVSTVDGPEPVLLGTAGNFVVLAKAGISCNLSSNIHGNIGISPAAASYITGFDLILDPSGLFSTSPLVNGNVYAADYATPTPDNLTVAVLDMQAAYVDAAGRPTPDFVNLGSGDISGLTLVPGLYNWDGAVSISAPIILDGAGDDVWIFQIAGSVVMNPNVQMILSGGAQAKNVFWQTFGPLILHSGNHLEGNVLCSTAINLDANASVTGRLLSHTAISLNQNFIIAPNP